MDELKLPGYKCVGTTRSNRVTKKCPLMNVKQMDSKSCGYYDPVTVQLNSADIMLTRWKDNTVVTVASTVFGAEPTGKVRRWTKAISKI